MCRLCLPLVGRWGLTASSSRLLSPTHFYSMVFPPAPPTLVLACAVVATPSTLLPVFTPGL